MGALISGDAKGVLTEIAAAAPQRGDGSSEPSSPSRGQNVPAIVEEDDDDVIFEEIAPSQQAFAAPQPQPAVGRPQVAQGVLYQDQRDPRVPPGFSPFIQHRQRFDDAEMPHFDD